MKTLCKTCANWICPNDQVCTKWIWAYSVENLIKRRSKEKKKHYEAAGIMRYNISNGRWRQFLECTRMEK